MIDRKPGPRHDVVVVVVVGKDDGRCLADKKGRFLGKVGDAAFTVGRCL